jgi:hypothetical protein
VAHQTRSFEACPGDAPTGPCGLVHPDGDPVVAPAPLDPSVRPLRAGGAVRLLLRAGGAVRLLRCCAHIAHLEGEVKFIQYREPGEKMPRFHGPAWVDWYTGRAYFALIPFNWLIAFARWFYFGMKYTPNRLWMSPADAYWQGVADADAYKAYKEEKSW